MFDINDFIAILKIPEPSAVNEWLKAASRLMRGYSTQAEIIRRYINDSQTKVEVKRWSEDKYLPLTTPAPRANLLMLRADGCLIMRSLNEKRYLRRKPDDKIVDETYIFEQIDNPSEKCFLIIRRRIVLDLYKLGYENWTKLDRECREVLVDMAGNWQDAALALKQSEGNDRVETLQLFLGPQANAELQQGILQAGISGELHPGTEVLPWLLSTADWNMQQGLVALARNAAADDLEKAWSLTDHPNQQIRLRLADLIEKGDLLGWLLKEPDEDVRKRILLSIERNLTPRNILAKISIEPDKSRREVLGWALANWSTGITDPADWDALNKALFADIGKKNIAKLKEMLSQHGKLSLKGKILLYQWH
ncbi:MAG: hypothetical protein K6G50_04915 [bacterium]|nr:hypothetical protein [bacterium]